MIYEFYNDDGRFMMEIKCSSMEAEEPSVIKNLLNRFKAGKPEYNADDWFEFLEKEGYRVDYVKADYDIPF